SRRGEGRMDPSRLRAVDAETLGGGPQDRVARERARPVPGDRMIRQITDGPYINHPTYFLQSSFFPGDREMFFTSYRTGTAQLFSSALATGETRQLTDGPPIHPYSAALHPDGRTIVVTRGGGLWAGDRRIAEMPGAQFGECSISPDGEWLTAAF